VNQKVNRVEIPLSKKRIILILLGSLAFVAAGIWFVVKPATFSDSGPLRGSTVVVTVVGVAAILFFGLCAVYAMRKLPDNKPGLVIDASGITDNSGGVSAGLVLWTDINGLSVITVQKQKFILLHVKNPNDYIERQTGLIKRKMMQMNFKMYGSPLTIGANGLKIDFDELLKLIEERMDLSRAVINPQTSPGSFE
jgi:hypothetical protein